MKKIIVVLLTKSYITVSAKMSVSENLQTYIPLSEHRAFIQIKGSEWAEVDLEWINQFIPDLCEEFCELVIRKKDDIYTPLHATDKMHEVLNSLDNMVTSLGGNIDPNLVNKLYGHVKSLEQNGKEVQNELREILELLNKQRYQKDGTLMPLPEFIELDKTELIDLVKTIRDQTKPRHKYTGADENLNECLRNDSVKSVEAGERYIRENAFCWYIDWHEQMDENVSEPMKYGVEAYNYAEGEIERMERLIGVFKKALERFPNPSS